MRNCSAPGGESGVGLWHGAGIPWRCDDYSWYSFLGVGWIREHSKNYLGQIFLWVGVIRSCLILHLQASLAEGLMSPTCDVDINVVFYAVSLKQAGVQVVKDVGWRVLWYSRRNGPGRSYRVPMWWRREETRPETMPRSKEWKNKFFQDTSHVPSCETTEANTAPSTSPPPGPVSWLWPLLSRPGFPHLLPLASSKDGSES